MSTVIRSLMVKVGADLTGMQKGFVQASKDLKRAGKELSSAGDSLTKGLTLPVLGAAAGLTSVIGKALESADSLQQLSDVTGLSAERLQELKYVGTKLDVELESMTGSQRFLTKAMSAAQAGTKAQVEIFKKLGISVTDSSGHLRDSNVVFTEAITALHNMKNPTERNAIALKLFGRSALALNPLIQASGDKIAKLADEAHKSGAVIDGESVESMDKFADSMSALKLSLGGIIGKMTAELTPTFEKLIPIIQSNIIPGIQSFAQKIADLIIRFSKMSPGMQNFIVKVLLIAAALGPVLSVAGKFTTVISGMAGGIGKAIKAFQLAGGGLSGLGSAFGALLGPVGITLLVIAAVAAAAYLIIKNWGPISNFFKNLWSSVTGWFVTAWNNIKGFFGGLWVWMKSFFAQWGPLILAVIAPFIGIPLLIAKNWDQIKVWLGAAWEAIKGSAANAISAIISFFNSLPGNIGYALGYVIGSIIKWGIDILSWVTTNIPIIVGSIITFFAELPGKIWSTITTAFQYILQWGSNILNWAVANVPVIVGSIINFFASIPGKIWGALVAVISKLGEWAKAAINWAIVEVPKIVSGILSFFWELPGKMLNIGLNIITGLWNGIKNSAKWLKDRVGEFVGGFVQGIKDRLGIRSPSKVMANIGRNICLGLSYGINDSKNFVASAITGLSSDLTVNPTISAMANTSSVQTVNHSGVIRVEGVNSAGDLIGVAQLIANQTSRETRRRSSGVSFSPVMV